MVTTLADPATDRLLFVLAGQQNRERPGLELLWTVLNEMCGSTPPGLAPLMPPEFVLERPRTSHLEPFAFRDAYLSASARTHAAAESMSTPLLASVYGGTWWQLLRQLMDRDLDEVRLRLQDATFEYADRLVTGNSRRKAGRIDRTSVDKFRSEARKFLKVLSLVAHEGRQFAELIMPEMEKRGWIVVAPPLREFRAALAGLSGEIRALMGGVQSLEGELEWLEARRPSTVATAGLWTAVRNRALVAIAVTSAARADALSRLSLEDFERDHQGPAPDGRRGPALLLCPRKKGGRWETFWRPVPDEVGLIIEIYLVVRAAHCAFNGKEPAGPKDALLVGDATLMKHGSSSRLTKWLNRRSGTRPPFVRRRREHRNPALGPEAAAVAGYTLHEVRHLCSQQAERAGYLWEERYPSRELNSISGGAYASALLLNGSERQSMRELYGDRRTDAMVEVLAKRAAQIIWELVSTDAGLRRRPDLEGYQVALQRLRRLEDEEHRALARADRLQRRSGAIPAGDTGASESELLRILELIRADNRELKEIMLEGLGISHQLSAIHQRKDDTTKALMLLRHDPGTWRPISDEEPDGAERVDWRVIDAPVLGKALMPGDVACGWIRRWLTVREFSFLADDLPRTTLARWMKGLTLPRSKHKRPWEADSVPVDSSLGLSYRRIWVPGVKDAFWRTKTMRDHLDDLLTRWPDEQGWTKLGKPTTRCHAELVLPFRMQGELRSGPVNVVVDAK